MFLTQHVHMQLCGVCIIQLWRKFLINNRLNFVFGHFLIVLSCVLCQIFIAGFQIPEIASFGKMLLDYPALEESDKSLMLGYTANRNTETDGFVQK